MSILSDLDSSVFSEAREKMLEIYGCCYDEEEIVDLLQFRDLRDRYDIWSYDEFDTEEEAWLSIAEHFADAVVSTDHPEIVAAVNMDDLADELQSGDVTDYTDYFLILVLDEGCIVWYK